MTIPTWPFGHGKMTFDGNSVIPQAVFAPDFGPPIHRPRSTAMQERANVSVMFYDGRYAEFKAWWANTSRGGQFITTDPRSDADVVLQPVDGAFSFRTILGKNEASGMVEIIQVTFSADILPAPAT